MSLHIPDALTTIKRLRAERDELRKALQEIARKALAAEINFKRAGAALDGEE
jgi:uncharacterized protein involved in exopolysaccharide biosynthesis